MELAVNGDDVGMLIGPRGQTLSAIQELTRTVAQRRAPGGPRPASWSTSPATAWTAGRRWSASPGTWPPRWWPAGVVRVLEPMPPADRKVVHDTVNSIDGVSTTSEGEEPRRRVVDHPRRAGGRRRQLRATSRRRSTGWRWTVAPVTLRRWTAGAPAVGRGVGSA